MDLSHYNRYLLNHWKPLIWKQKVRSVIHRLKPNIKRCFFCERRIYLRYGKYKRYMNDFLVSEISCKRCHNAKVITWFDKIKFKLIDWRLRISE